MADKKTKKQIKRVIEIPEGVEININKTKEIKVKSGDNEISRVFDMPNIDILKKDNMIEIKAKKSTKRESKIAGTFNAHIKNMIRGVKDGFTYKLEICNVHFPMNVKVDEQNNRVLIKSFLGETKERTAKILDNVKVEIKGNEVSVTGNDINKAGQTAANIEKATKVPSKDRRIFQDGIFITEKPGGTL